jgi:hypothetical protein
MQRLNAMSVSTVSGEVGTIGVHAAIASTRSTGAAASGLCETFVGKAAMIKTQKKLLLASAIAHIRSNVIGQTGQMLAIVLSDAILAQSFSSAP